jgi:hypothetical protein
VSTISHATVGQREKERHAMKNMWKGLVVGAVSGAAAGLALDRRATPTSPTPIVHQVADEAAAALSSLKQGVSTVSDRLQDSDAPQAVADAAGALRQKARDLNLPGDTTATDVVKAGAAKAAAIGSDVADKVKAGLPGS